LQYNSIHRRVIIKMEVEATLDYDKYSGSISLKSEKTPASP